jgi:hypothetical protein
MFTTRDKIVQIWDFYGFCQAALAGLPTVFFPKGSIARA